MKSSSVDPCVYYKNEDGSIVYMQIYVDDLLIFYNNKEKGEEIKQQLKNNFNMKTLGPVNHFIGWRIKLNEKRDQIQIDWTAYIEKILLRFKMTECNPVYSPCDTSNKLVSTGGKT